MAGAPLGAAPHELVEGGFVPESLAPPSLEEPPSPDVAPVCEEPVDELPALPPVELPVELPALAPLVPASAIPDRAPADPLDPVAPVEPEAEPPPLPEDVNAGGADPPLLEQPRAPAATNAKSAVRSIMPCSLLWCVLRTLASFERAEDSVPLWVAFEETDPLAAGIVRVPWTSIKRLDRNELAIPTELQLSLSGAPCEHRRSFFRGLRDGAAATAGPT